eukprot:14755057-Alexandrium_andersonii.AAC.1
MCRSARFPDTEFIIRLPGGLLPPRTPEKRLRRARLACFVVTIGLGKQSDAEPPDEALQGEPVEDVPGSVQFKLGAPETS